ncbi:hypothetical protein K435DRAFT_974818 [Dendrothele bispora CBS 962.96]|uniref:Uncharacterized protein n=1 Tax=Dendrothele bispora (strain CBS 962.96) TaxID=1314807 RepID=A0A4S8KJ72_DENBC|nr:hypothetical protein K435DRAFT_974818 [Dendrothele bispora CBS 962.96]
MQPLNTLRIVFPATPYNTMTQSYHPPDRGLRIALWTPNASNIGCCCSPTNTYAPLSFFFSSIFIFLSGAFKILVAD